MPTLQQLEELLQAEPDDVFLQYAVAMAFVSQGDSAEGLARLQAIVHENPDHVAAYFQAAQLLAQADQIEAARELARRGIDAAVRVGDSHAAGEMTGFLETL